MKWLLLLVSLNVYSFEGYLDCKVVDRCINRDPLRLGMCIFDRFRIQPTTNFNRAKFTSYGETTKSYYGDLKVDDVIYFLSDARYRRIELEIFYSKSIGISGTLWYQEAPFEVECEYKKD